MKEVLSHKAGVDFPSTDGVTSQNVTPLLDCVADMQVVFGLDMGSAGGGADPNGVIGTYTNPNGSTIVGGLVEDEGKSQADVQKVLSSASELRNRLMEIRVYILAHEGQRDPNYTFNNFTCGCELHHGRRLRLRKAFDLPQPGRLEELQMEGSIPLW